MAVEPVQILRFLEHLEGEMQQWARMSHQLVAAANLAQLRTAEGVAATRIQSEVWVNRVAEDAGAVNAGLAVVETVRLRSTSAHEHARAAEVDAAAALDLAEQTESAAVAHMDWVERELRAAQAEHQAALSALQSAESRLHHAHNELAHAVAQLQQCLSQPPDRDGNPPDCSGPAARVADAERAVSLAEDAVAAARARVAAAAARVQHFQTLLARAREAVRAAREALATAAEAASIASSASSWAATAVEEAEVAAGHGRQAAASLAAEQAAVGELAQRALAATTAVGVAEVGGTRASEAQSEAVDRLSGAAVDLSTRMDFLRSFDTPDL